MQPSERRFSLGILSTGTCRVVGLPARVVVLETAAQLKDRFPSTLLHSSLPIIAGW